MEPNNFERTVRQKMEELKIPPSEFVWTNIEKEIGKRKKNKRNLIAFILFSILLLWGGYRILILPKKDLKPNPSLQITAKNEPIHALVKDSSSHNGVGSGTQKIKKVDLSASSRSSAVSQKWFSKNIKVQGITPPGDSGFAPSSVMGDRQRNAGNPVAVAKGYTTIPQTDSRAQKTNAEVMPDSAGPGRSNPSQNIQNFSRDTMTIIPKANGADTANTLAANDTSNQQKQKRADKTFRDSSIAKKSARSVKKYHWIPGITFSAGSSQLINGPKGRPAYLSSSGGNPAGNTGNNPGYTYPPSGFKAAIAFNAGLVLEKNISPKARISFGFTYSFLSLVNKVGNRIDSFNSTQNLFSGYYSAGNNSHSFSNNFQFLEVPVSAEFQLNHGKKLSLAWNAGINLSDLIGSNALQFDYNSSIYYHDNRLFNKLQLGLHTGFSATVFSLGKYPFTFGPSFYYGLTNLSDRGLYDHGHFSLLELKAAIVLRKK